MKPKSKNEVSNNGSFDYIHLYKSAAETTVKLKPDHDIGPELTKKLNKRSKNKKVLESTDDNQKARKPVSENAESALSSTNETTVSNNAKPIIKNPNNASGVSKAKPKKRNKSVSFVLDDKDEVTVKKTKSESTTMDSKKTESAEIKSKGNKDRKKNKKTVKATKPEKENDSNNVSDMLNENIKDKNILTNSKQAPLSDQENNESTDSKVKIEVKKNREFKKPRNKHKLKEKDASRQNIEMVPENEVDANNVQSSKKSKKKKHSPKPMENIDTTEGEPAIKTRKQHIKPDVVAKDLENLDIGDNTHKLTNLLDEMAVVDKKKQKKKKHNKKNAEQSATPTADVDLDGSNEKQKWKKKRWNKDKKPLKRNDQYLSLVIVDNLPIDIILNYKKLLQEHFTKCGPIKRIGTAEVYLSEDPKPVFTTTILFDDENTALKAVEEDNTPFQGSFIRVKKALPPKETTLVVRSYGELTQQALSSTFNGAGRIRNIEIMSKRKKLMSSAFVEFDGALDFDRLTKIAADTKIGNKPIYVSRFEYRTPRTSDRGKNSVANETAGDSDSSDD